MKLTAPLALGVLVAAAWAAEAASAGPGPEDRDAAPCPACSLECLAGTTNCWGCGKRLSKWPFPKGSSVELVVVKVLPDEKAYGPGSVATPEAEYEKVEKWIAEHPTDLKGALKRLQDVMAKVSGTALEETAAERMKQVRNRIDEINRPKTAEERKAEAAKMVMKVMALVNKYPDRVAENMERLEGLLKIAEGTPYEQLVLRKITELRKKLE